MDHAVALVEAYLQINGYFTVAEYPVIVATARNKTSRDQTARDKTARDKTSRDQFKIATDLDILAFFFPGAGRIITRKKTTHSIFAPDPVLGVSGADADMIIGEVKEGKAELNNNAKKPNVLRIVLARFGCCPLEHVDVIVEQLIHKGKASSHDNHRIRLMAFGSFAENRHEKYSVITLGHITQFIENYLDEHWDVLRHAQIKHPALGLFMVLKKARQGLALQQSDTGGLH